MPNRQGAHRSSQTAQTPPTVTQMPRLLDEAEAAEYLHCSVAFLRRCRLFRSGPSFVKVGRLVRYRSQDLEQYISESTQRMAA